MKLCGYLIRQHHRCPLRKELCFVCLSCAEGLIFSEPPNWIIEQRTVSGSNGFVEWDYFNEFSRVVQPYFDPIQSCPSVFKNFPLSDSNHLRWFFWSREMRAWQLTWINFIPRWMNPLNLSASLFCHCRPLGNFIIRLKCLHNVVFAELLLCDWKNCEHFVQLWLFVAVCQMREKETTG